MLDALGRPISYLRLSITQACSMRCLYCRPPGHVADAGPTLLTAREIERLAHHLVQNHGLTKIRLTGGEPTARPDLIDIIRRLAGIDGLRHLAMTTNGLTLATHAAEYRRAGLQRVNISLDSLDRATFRRMTGVDGLDRVIHGVDAAIAAGLTPVRLNTVVIAGENDAELPQLVQFAAERNVEIRFIELMAMGPLAAQWAQRFVSAQSMRDRLDPLVINWRKLEQGADSACRYHLLLRDGRHATIGFITPMTCNFCSACDRIRIAADGTLYPCLMDLPGPSLLEALRPTLNAARLDRLLQAGLSRKKPEHAARGHAMMVHIGG